MLMSFFRFFGGFFACVPLAAVGCQERQTGRKTSKTGGGRGAGSHPASQRKHGGGHFRDNVKHSKSNIYEKL